MIDDLNRPGGYFRPFARPRYRVRIMVHPAGAHSYGFVFTSRARSEAVARKNSLDSALRDVARRYPDADADAEILKIETR